MKLLIIGRDGFIGNELVNTALKKGHQVLTTSRRTGRPVRHTPYAQVRFDLTHNSITKVVSPERLKEYDAAVICAAITNLNQCFYEQEYCYEVNVAGTKRLIEELAEAQVKPVYLSSDQVLCAVEGYHDETVPLAPLVEYGRQKAETEIYMRQLGGNALTLRLALTVGDKFDGAHLFSEWYEKYQAKEPIYCIKNQMLTPTFVEDVAEGVLKALEMDLTGLYNLVNLEYLSRYELACRFFNYLKISAEIKEVDLEFMNFPEKRAIRSNIDGTKFQKTTGISFTPMEEVFRRISK